MIYTYIHTNTHVKGEGAGVNSKELVEGLDVATSGVD